MSRSQSEGEDEMGGITNQVYSMANHTFKFAADTFWGSPGVTTGEEDMNDVISRLESLPGTHADDNSSSRITPSKTESDRSSTMALSIPAKIKSSPQVSASMNTPSSGITFGMGSSWKSNRRVRSSNSESGYGSSFYGSSMKSNLSLLGHKEESPEKQNHLDNLPLLSLEEVQKHCYEDDAWMVFYDRVYNVTDFLIEHPGGMDVMQEYLGLDATVAFQGVGHSPDALEMMETYLIGVLPKSERAYYTGNGWTEMW